MKATVYLSLVQNELMCVWQTRKQGSVACSDFYAKKKCHLSFKRKYSDEYQRSSRFPNYLKNVKNSEWYARNHAMKKWAAQ